MEERLQMCQAAQEISCRTEEIYGEYEILFKIAPEARRVQTVFQKKSFFWEEQLPEEEFDLKLLLDKMVDEKDRGLLEHFLSQSSAEGLGEEKESRKIEFRMASVEGNSVWAEGKLFAKNRMGSREFFLEVRRLAGQRNRKESMKKRLMEECLGIAQLELSGGTADILWPLPGKSPVKKAGWKELIQKVSQEMIEPEDRKRFLRIMSLEYLCQKTEGAAELRCFRENASVVWVKIQWFPAGKRRLWIVFKDISESRKFRQMVKAICGDCDFVLCLSGAGGSFEAYGKIPEYLRTCENYTEVAEKYIRKYAVTTDRNRLREEMELGSVLQRLEDAGEYSITFGSSENERDYRRKQIRYVYLEGSQKKILMICRDITKMYQKRVRRQEEMRKAVLRSRTDELTGLYNRFVKELIERRLEQEQRKAAVLFIDLDNFKLVNDTWGHAVGDIFLKETAEILKNATRSCDIGGRLGGDEFVVYLSGIKGEETALGCARRLRRSIRKLVTRKYPEVNVSCCVGVAVYPDDGRDIRHLFECADQAAYYAKRNGKNRVAAYSQLCRETELQ